MAKTAIVFLVLAGFLFWAGQLSAYQGTTVSNGGKITGVAKFLGKAPLPRKLKVVKNQDYCGTNLLSDELVVSRDNRIKGVVVNIEGISKGKKIIRRVVVLDNNKCYFRPHVQAAVARSPIHVKNSDPVLHNTHAYLGRRTVFNLALPTKGLVIKKKLRRRAGLVTVKCDAHNWMRAVIKTFDHPYFSVTDERGAFEITDVPPGKYKLTAWHEILGTQQKEITVSPRGKVEVEFSFKK